MRPWAHQVGVWEQIADQSSKGFILDGFPRTVDQAKLLARLLGAAHLDLALRIDVPVERVVERLGRRRVCTACGLDHPEVAAGSACHRCGNVVAPRSDDTPAAIRARLAIYDRHETELVTWLRSTTTLISVDGDGQPEKVAQRVLAATSSHPTSHSDRIRQVAESGSVRARNLGGLSTATG